MIERIDEINYGVSGVDVVDTVYTKNELIHKIRMRDHPIDDQLISIIENMKIGEITKKPEAFYGDIPSVNGVPKRA